MSKYAPLHSYLAGLPSGTHTKTLTFETIQKILNDTLPPSAYRHCPWWANEVNGTHVHAKSWLNAGWHVASINMSQQWVRFERTGLAKTRNTKT